MKIDKKYIRYATGILTILVAFFFFPFKGEEFEVKVDRTVDTSQEIVNESDSITEIKNDIFCDISGEVNNPGLYSLKEGDRLESLIEMAGGLTDDADINRINRARFLTDGEKIIIPNFDSNDSYVTGEGIDYIDYNNDKININTSDAAHLQSIPGVGPVTAEKIVSYRNENGSFNALEDLMKVSGIGEKTFEKMKDYITI